jgi:hypothetical protein
VTDTTSKLIERLQRSWLLKLAWVAAPLAQLVLMALIKRTTGQWAGPLVAAMLVFFLVILASSYGFGLIERRRRRARLRGMSPLQRVQMSDESNLPPLSETFRIADHPAVETLPRAVQSAVAFWGASLPKPWSKAVVALDLFIVVLLMTMIFMNDPMGELARRLGAPLLPYWPVFATLAVGLIILRIRGRLSQMHRHHVAEAATMGRRPFPAL